MECSLPGDDLEKILQPSQWDHPVRTSASGLRVQVGAWQLLLLLLSLRASSSWTEAAMAWQALLLQESHIVHEEKSESFSIVLKSSIFGSLLWLAEVVVIGQLTFSQPAVGERAKCRWQMVLGWRRWRVVPTAPVPAHLVVVLTGVSA